MSRRKLHISEDLAFPLELITERIAVLATTGAGKTYLTRIIVEEVYKARQQVVVLDPKGDFWGLRSSADAKSEGFPIPIFGGEHADFPLEPGSGAFVAELIVREGISAVLDMSLFSKTKMFAWATEFAERFLHKNREAMMLAIDEAHRFAPQKYRGNERMLGAFTDLVTLGRKRGIGTILASQRSALLNKDVLDLTGTMFALRSGSPRDRAAIDDWLEYNASPEIRREIMEDLPKMPTGEAWVYSPHTFNLLERIRVRSAETFDSSRVSSSRICRSVFSASMTNRVRLLTVAPSPHPASWKRIRGAVLNMLDAATIAAESKAAQIRGEAK